VRAAEVGTPGDAADADLEAATDEHLHRCLPVAGRAHQPELGSHVSHEHALTGLELGERLVQGAAVTGAPDHAERVGAA
jgi:hypothetical protein